MGSAGADRGGSASGVVGRVCAVPKRVFLHVGLPKSGTKFIQSVLAGNKEKLEREAGLLYPGRSWPDQVRAVRDVREMPPRNKRQRVEVPGSWNRLAAEVNAFPGDAVISMEWLCRSEPHQIQRIIHDFEGAQVEVVFTLRDLARTIPSSWQESIQKRSVWSWPGFLEEIASDMDGATAEEEDERRFWRLHDAVALIARWTQFVPPEQVHLITVPKAGAPRLALWERFAGVLGIDASAYVAEGVATNASLGLEWVEMMRLLNAKTRESGMSADTHRTIITQQLGKRELSNRRHRELPLTLPGDLHDWVRARAAREIDGIAAAGVDVVGDLEELQPDLSGPVGAQPQDLDTGVLLDTALDALVIAVRQRAVASKNWEKQMKKLARREARERRRVEAWMARPLRSAVRIHARRSRLVRAVVGRLRGGKRRGRGRAGAEG